MNQSTKELREEYGFDEYDDNYDADPNGEEYDNSEDEE